MDGRKPSLGVAKDAKGGQGREALGAHALHVGLEGESGVPPDAQPPKGDGGGDGGTVREGDWLGGPIIIADSATRGVEVEEFGLGRFDFEADVAKEPVEGGVSCPQAPAVFGYRGPNDGEKVVVHVGKEIASRVLEPLENDTCKNGREDRGDGRPLRGAKVRFGAGGESNAIK